MFNKQHAPSRRAPELAIRFITRRRFIANKTCSATATSTRDKGKRERERERKGKREKERDREYQCRSYSRIVTSSEVDFKESLSY